MTKEDKKEIIKAHFYGYTTSLIKNIYKIEENELYKILEEEESYLKELEERIND